MKVSLLLISLVIFAKQGCGQEFLYVTDVVTNNLYMIDPTTTPPSVIATVSVLSPTPPFTGGFAIAFTPDSLTGYVTNRSGTKSIYQFNTIFNSTTPNTVTTFIAQPGSFPFVSNPSGMVITPDGSTLFIGLNRGHAVEIADITSKTMGAIFTTITTTGFANFNSPEQLVVTPDGSTVYVANLGAGNENVYIVDITNPADSFVTGLVSTITVPPAMGPSFPPFAGPNSVAISPDGLTIYVPDITPCVYVIDTTTNQATALIQTGSFPAFAFPIRATVSPDGKLLYISDQVNALVYVADTTTNQVTATVSVDTTLFPAFAGPFEIAFLSDSSTAYVTDDGNGTVYVIDVASSSVSAIVTNANPPFGGPFAIANLTAPVVVVTPTVPTAVAQTAAATATNPSTHNAVQQTNNLVTQTQTAGITGTAQGTVATPVYVIPNTPYTTKTNLPPSGCK